MSAKAANTEGRIRARTLVKVGGNLIAANIKRADDNRFPPHTVYQFPVCSVLLFLIRNPAVGQYHELGPKKSDTVESVMKAERCLGGVLDIGPESDGPSVSRERIKRGKRLARV